MVNKYFMMRHFVAFSQSNAEAKFRTNILKYNAINSNQMESLSAPPQASVPAQLQLFQPFSAPPAPSIPPRNSPDSAALHRTRMLHLREPALGPQRPHSPTPTAIYLA
jgi:hypothetical protein